MLRRLRALFGDMNMFVSSDVLLAKFGMRDRIWAQFLGVLLAVRLEAPLDAEDFAVAVSGLAFTPGAPERWRRCACP